MAEKIDLINRAEAIEVIERIQKQKQKRDCSAQALREATALGYAIQVLKNIPSYEEGKR